MTRTHNIAGRRHGMLVAVRKSHMSGKNSVWLFVCDCGAEKYALLNNVVRGLTVSCGCAKTAAIAQAATTHGLSHSPEWGVWSSMKQRCENQNTKEFRIYGARGIKVCARWHDFANFIGDMGPRPSPRHSIDRTDNDGDYEPSNCKWATRTEQARNTRSNHVIEIDGQRKTIAEWSEQSGLGRTAIQSRIRRGWPPCVAVTSPPGSRLSNLNPTERAERRMSR